jgi:membrane protease YdiL (CAAX protease family)
MNRGWTILIQAALFTLPQLLAALLLSPLQGVVFAVVYSWLGVGVVGGWAAARTQSIWPSLASATLWNMIMIAWVLY